jgi:hypothetical protein
MLAPLLEGPDLLGCRVMGATGFEPVTSSVSELKPSKPEQVSYLRNLIRQLSEHVLRAAEVAAGQ